MYNGILHVRFAAMVAAARLRTVMAVVLDLF
jgi:hypothetical protein